LLVNSATTIIQNPKNMYTMKAAPCSLSVASMAVDK